MDLIQELKDWRSRRSMRDGVEPFRIISNETLNAIVLSRPKSKEELIEIKGFKDKKFAKYGKEILDLINNGSLFAGASDMAPIVENKPLEPKERKIEASDGPRIFTVSQFLDLVNIALQDFRVKVQGEISSVEPRGNVVYFSLKDKADGAMIRCLMWQSNYRLSGVKFEEGLEVVVYGSPNIWKPTGGMSFRAETVELVGEGALKKAYEELKLKLEKEGVFSQERKKPIPEYPEKIGLITSKTGAVIHDFLNNIGKFGYKISFYDSRVEGQLAVPDLMKAVEYFKDKDIDILVVIRGGGSLESLLAFNNEVLTREIVKFPKPVICGIGHDKDVPLFSLACDLSVSTPTAVTKVLNSSWEKAPSKVQISEKEILSRFSELLALKRYFLYSCAERLKDGFSYIFEEFARMDNSLRSRLVNMQYHLKFYLKKLEESRSRIISSFVKRVSGISDALGVFDRAIQMGDPERQLKLGYAIIRNKGKVLKSVQGLEIGNIIDIKVADGEVGAEVRKINKNGKTRSE